MDAALKSEILDILDRHRIMTIATLRPDGWPQATTVGFANEGLTLYFLCGPESQKAANIARDNRVSLTIDRDTDQFVHIKGLSMAAHAERMTDRDEGMMAMGLMFSRYPEQKGIPIAPPTFDESAIFRVTPKVISVLDYSKGFAHTDLVTL